MKICLLLVVLVLIGCDGKNSEVVVNTVPPKQTSDKVSEEHQNIEPLGRFICVGGELRTTLLAIRSDAQSDVFPSTILITGLDGPALVGIGDITVLLSGASNARVRFRASQYQKGLNSASGFSWSYYEADLDFLIRKAAIKRTGPAPSLDEVPRKPNTNATYILNGHEFALTPQPDGTQKLFRKTKGGAWEQLSRASCDQIAFIKSSLVN